MEKLSGNRGFRKLSIIELSGVICNGSEKAVGKNGGKKGWKKKRRRFGEGIEERMVDENYGSRAPLFHVRRIKDVTSSGAFYSCLGKEENFAAARQGGPGKKWMRDRGLVNNTKRQVARKRRYFSGGWWCTRAADKGRSKDGGKGKSKRVEAGKETKEIHQRLYFQWYVNAVAYGIMEIVTTAAEHPWLDL